MRNAFIIALIIFVLVAGAAYSISWFSQASAAHTAIEKAIESINQRHPKITYEGITTAGFPTELRVSIVKPQYNGVVPADLMAEISGQRGKNMEWKNSIALDGAITFTINAYSNQYKMLVDGEWRMTSTLNGATINGISKSKGPSICTLDLVSNQGFTSNLWNFSAIVQSPKELAQNLQKFDCYFQGGELLDPANNKRQASYGLTRFYLNNTPSGNSTSARAYIKLTDSEVTPYYDKKMAELWRALYGDMMTAPFLGAVQGKQNAEFDISYSGPIDWSQPGANTMPLDIQIGKFNVSNAIYQSDFTFRLTNALKEAQRSARLMYKAEMQAKPAYNELNKAILQSFIHSVYTDEKATDLKAAFANYTPEQAYQILLPALPDIASLGKITSALDISYNGADGWKKGDIDLSTFELSTTPYGLLAKGKGKLAETSPIPSVGISLACNNCMQMVDDIVGYVERIRRTVSAFSPEQAMAMSISPEQVFGFKNFLKALGQAAASKDGKRYLSYSIATNGVDGTVNGKSMQEVMMLFMHYMDPAGKQKPRQQ
jgi:hypothetical protein